MKVDYLVVGQGICGSFLSWYLEQAGKSICVMDQLQPFAATPAASGIINPVTGRQVVTTWMAAELLTFAREAYRQLGECMGEILLQECPILTFPASQQMQQAYAARIQQGNAYIQNLDREQEAVLHNYFHFYFGGVAIRPTYLIQLHALLRGWRRHLSRHSTLAAERFNPALLRLEETHIHYRDIHAQKIIFCNGADTFVSPFWNKLPYVLNKGQALTAAIPGLPADAIYKFGSTTLAPWYDGLWWIGSSYENDYASAAPDPGFRERALQSLRTALALPFTPAGHLSGIRPATVERRPFVGLHPVYPQVGILNGMGTKGCSLAPYFAWQLASHLAHGTPLDPAADVQRFSGILRR